MVDLFNASDWSSWTMEDSNTVNQYTVNCSDDTNTGHMTLTTSVGLMVAAKPFTEMITNILVGLLVDRFV